MKVDDSVSKTKYTILYIEDNPANLRLVLQLLTNIPEIHSLSATEPRSGINLALEYRPDLILLDINLPGMNGFEVLTKLQQNEKTSHIPVIAISANAMPKDIEYGMSAGFDDYITKPINLKRLIKSISNILDCDELISIK